MGHIARPGTICRIARVPLRVPSAPRLLRQVPARPRGTREGSACRRSAGVRWASSLSGVQAQAQAQVQPQAPEAHPRPLPSSLSVPSREEMEARFGGPKEGDTIVVAVSGGVDSSTTLARLCLTPSDVDARQPKFDIHVVFMRNWNSLDEGDDFEPGASGGGDGCEWVQDWKDVQAVTAYLRRTMKSRFPSYTPQPIAGPLLRSHSRPPQFPTTSRTFPSAQPDSASTLLPIHFVDFTRQYWTDVFEPALEQWEAGQTPNPDVSCNRSIKFGALIRELFGLPGPSTTPFFPPGQTYFEHRAALGKAWLATGHYAGIRWDRELNGLPRPRLIRSSDPNKDQTYYLSSVQQDALRYIIFPLSEMRKTDVKRFAYDLGLPTAERIESMGLCFVGERQKKSTAAQIPSRADLTERLGGVRPAVEGEHKASDAQGSETILRDPRIPSNSNATQVPRLGVSLANHFASFVAKFLPPQASAPGKIIHLETGKLLGEHSGLHTLTLGQKARIGGRPQKAYVAAKGHTIHPETKQREAIIYVVDGQHHPALLCEAVYIPTLGFDWIGSLPAGIDQESGRRVQTQIRHRQEPVPGSVRIVYSLPDTAVPLEEEAYGPLLKSGQPEGRQKWYEVRFDEPIVGVAPGQVVALWDNEGATLGSGSIHRALTAWDRQRQSSS